MLKIQRFVFSPFYENTYVIWDKNSKDAAIIDPGCYDDKERSTLDEFIKKELLQIKYLINTHCHIDHIFGNAYLKEKYNPTFLAPEKDLFMLDLMIDTANSYGVEFTPSPKPDKLIDETEPFILGGSIGKFIFTPGHTPGEYCLYFEKEKICFTGDVLFCRSIGRTDLWGGNYEMLLHSIRTKLFTLPGETIIYPGHESQSTIEDEKENNPFFKK
ncbi:MAG: MBL fold metallo-hydrolase [Ignavibacteriales bacterium]|nr:MBL fold metallo-hydrolase [Ignavibacteriales bacterium]